MCARAWQQQQGLFAKVSISLLRCAETEKSYIN